MAFGLVAFARECWKVGIFGEIFIKFALFELVPLMIYHDLSEICRRMCCCFFCDSFIWILRLRMISNFFVLHLSNFKSAGQNGWLECNQKLNRNTVNFEIERQMFYSLKFISETFKWKLMDQIIWNFSIYGHVKHILHSTDTIHHTSGKKRYMLEEMA